MARGEWHHLGTAPASGIMVLGRARIRRIACFLGRYKIAGCPGECLCLGHVHCIAYLLDKHPYPLLAHRSVEWYKALPGPPSTSPGAAGRPTDLSVNLEGRTHAWAENQLTLVPQAGSICPQDVPNLDHLGDSFFLKGQPGESPAGFSWMQLSLWPIRKAREGVNILY